MSRAECKRYVTCPMCKGAGRSGTHAAAAGTTLLSIQHETANLRRVTKTPIAETASASGDLRFPVLSDSECARGVNPATSYGDYAITLEDDHATERSASPRETLKLALRDLKQDQWRVNVPALIELAHISRTRPQLLDPSMPPRVYRILCSLLRNARPHVVRTVCQVAMELYKAIRCTRRPEFDELAAALLLKSTHTNMGVRSDAQAALDSMITHVPPATCVRILASEHGAGHKNPLIRATVSRLICNIVGAIGAECLLSNASMKDTRRQIFVMCSKFLLDGNRETRSAAKKTLKVLMAHQEFDVLFYQDVDSKIINNIEKQLVLLKYS